MHVYDVEQQLSTRTHTLTSLDLSNMRCPGLWKLCKIFPHNRSIRTLKLARYISLPYSYLSHASVLSLCVSLLTDHSL